MMEVPGDQIVDVVTVRDRGMSTARRVNMARGVASALMAGRAGGWVRRANFDRAFVHVVAMRVVEMAVMQIIDVIAVANGGVAAAGRVHVVVIRMGRVLHDFVPLREGERANGSSPWASAARTSSRT